MRSRPPHLRLKNQNPEFLPGKLTTRLPQNRLHRPMSNPKTPLHRSPPQFNIDSAPMRRRSAGQHAFSRESGQGLFVLLALLFFVGAGLIFSLARPAPPNIKNDKQTTAALADAKAALIGYAASDANRPGELPCPDAEPARPFRITRAATVSISLGDYRGEH
jgi:hypothetical protein